MFHIEAAEATPCPYCGGVLERDQDLFDDAPAETPFTSGDAPAETLFTSAEDLDIGGVSEKPASPSEKPPEPPGRPLAVPSPTSMITSGGGPAASPDSYLTQPGPWPSEAAEGEKPGGAGSQETALPHP